MKFHRFLIPGTFLLIASFTAFSRTANAATPAPVGANGFVLGDPQNAITDFNAAFKVINLYRKAHDGKYPKGNAEIVTDMLTAADKYGVRNFAEGRRIFTNPDYALSNANISPERAESVLAYKDNGYKRNDGSPVGGEKPAGSRDVLMWTDLYVSPNDITFPDGGRVRNPTGAYVVLWDDGSVAQIPYDLVLFSSTDGTSYVPLFPGQVDNRFDTLSYEERFPEATTPGKPTSGPGEEPVADNGGPESLLQLSRRVAKPGTSGIDRTKLWEAFDPSYVDFKLADLQTLSTPLGFPTQVKRINLDDLQASGTPAIISLKSTGRLVALLAMDDNRALIIDGGKILNVERTGIKADYTGEALVPAIAASGKPAIVADDPLRTIALPSLDAEVAQQVTLRNTSNKTITLQLPYPLLGVTEAKLSKTTLAPGESATLDLKLKWRPALQTRTQNVLVPLATSDTVAPNLQLAFLLSPPNA